MEARKLVGWNVRRLRATKQITIEELAGRADVDASYLARLERGEVNVGIVILDRIARALAASLSDVVVEPSPGERPPRPLPAGRRSAKSALRVRAR